jgi:hypothetical protein
MGWSEPLKAPRTGGHNPSCLLGRGLAVLSEQLLDAPAVRIGLMSWCWDEIERPGLKHLRQLVDKTAPHSQITDQVEQEHGDGCTVADVQNLVAVLVGAVLPARSLPCYEANKRLHKNIPPIRRPSRSLAGGTLPARLRGSPDGKTRRSQRSLAGRSDSATSPYNG